MKESFTKKKNMINSLQGWRAIMMVMIFILHICPNSIPLFAGGYETISYFIILSGFVLTLSFKGSDELSFKNIYSFTKKRIKKFYPLHIIILSAELIVIMPSAIKNGIKSILNLMLKFVLDSLLVQAFIPNEDFYFSINGVSWYLSATLFFYLIFIPLIRFYKKLDNKKSILFIALNIIIFSSVVFILQGCDNFSYWTYIFPVFRCLEFSSGILLGLLFKKVRENENFILNNKVFSTAFEIIIILFFVCERYLCNYTNTYSGNHNYQSIVGFFIALLIVFVFSFEKGFISKLISNKLFVFIGNISFEIFIIHTIVNDYVRTICAVLNINIPTVFATLIITIVAASLFHYKPIKNYINKKLGKND